jgi:hypothetical protein
MFVVSLMITAGLGYSAFTTTATVYVNANAGTLILEITSLSISSGPTYAKITGISPSLPSTGTVSFSVGPFAAGDQVVVSYTIKDVGTLPATELDTVGPNVANAPHCDTIFSSAPAAGITPLSLGAGQSFSSTIGITLSPETPASYGGCTATITFSVTGSA